MYLTSAALLSIILCMRTDMYAALSLGSHRIRRLCARVTPADLPSSTTPCYKRAHTPVTARPRVRPSPPLNSPSAMPRCPGSPLAPDHGVNGTLQLTSVGSYFSSQHIFHQFSFCGTRAHATSGGEWLPYMVIYLRLVRRPCIRRKDQNHAHGCIFNVSP